MFGYLTIDLLNSVSGISTSENSPTIVHASVAARRRGRVAGRDRAVEHHVVFLVGVHGEVVGRTDSAEVQLWSQPGVFRGPQVLPCDPHVGRFGL